VTSPDDKGNNSFWVKARLEHTPDDRKNYLLCKVTGFAYEYASMSEHDLAKYFSKQSAIRVSNDQPDITTVEIRGKQVPVVKPASVAATIREIASTSFFKDWVNKLSPEFTVSKIEIQSADVIGLKVRFIKMRATMTDKTGSEVPGVIFMRGRSVAVLLLLTVPDEKKKKYVVVTRHQRAAIGEYSHEEIPVGMEDEGPLGTVREIMENEIGISDDFHPINMNEAIFGQDKPIYTSPGATDEGMRFYLVELKVSQEQINEIQSKAKSGSILSLKLIDLEEVVEKCNDAKSILAVQLYSLYLKKTSHIKRAPTAMGKK